MIFDDRLIESAVGSARQGCDVSPSTHYTAATFLYHLALSIAALLAQFPFVHARVATKWLPGFHMHRLLKKHSDPISSFSFVIVLPCSIVFLILPCRCFSFGSLPMPSAYPTFASVALLLFCASSTCRGARICSQGSSPCPVGWADLGDKICSAPSGYGGGCLSLVRMWDDEFKQDFGMFLDTFVWPPRSNYVFVSQRIVAAWSFLVRKPVKRNSGVFVFCCVSCGFGVPSAIFQASLPECTSLSIVVLPPAACYVACAKDWELVDGICEARGEGYAGHRLHLRFRGPQC